MVMFSKQFHPQNVLVFCTQENLLYLVTLVMEHHQSQLHYTGSEIGFNLSCALDNKRSCVHEWHILHNRSLIVVKFEHHYLHGQNNRFMMKLPGRVVRYIEVNYSVLDRYIKRDKLDTN